MSKRAHISLTVKLAAALREMTAAKHELSLLMRELERLQGGGRLGAPLTPVAEHIPYTDAKQMTADQVLSLFTFDHGILHAIKVVDEHWNLTPRMILGHRKKSKRDAGIVAKASRIDKKVSRHAAKMAAKDGIDLSDIPEAGEDFFKKARLVRPKPGWPQHGRKIQSRGFDRRR